MEHIPLHFRVLNNEPYRVIPWAVQLDIGTVMGTVTGAHGHEGSFNMVPRRLGNLIVHRKIGNKVPGAIAKSIPFQSGYICLNVHIRLGCGKPCSRRFHVYGLKIDPSYIEGSQFKVIPQRELLKTRNFPGAYGTGRLGSLLLSAPSCKYGSGPCRNPKKDHQFPDFHCTTPLQFFQVLDL
jgi:hypothetical protein